MDPTMILLFSAVLIVGALLFGFMTLSKNGRGVLDVTKYRCRWLDIEQKLRKDDVNSYTVTVLAADKLVDQALRDKGYKGDTMGQRMKSAQALWSNADTVWNAHKVRNLLAHEDDYHLSYEATRRALSGFKQALKDLGAI